MRIRTSRLMRATVRGLAIAGFGTLIAMLPTTVTSAAPEPSTNLTLAIDGFDGTTRSVTLTCNPTGGTHPRAEAACQYLADGGKLQQPPNSIPKKCNTLKVDCKCPAGGEVLHLHVNGTLKGKRVVDGMVKGERRPRFEPGRDCCVCTFNKPDTPLWDF
ncbi:SSI family serine proteinase inhibitor [Nocardia sp. NPDC050435]|uniref:SSI family serine proteinase inhibitor n=1 Tax=Nocardia sp. NPDC050435 TaxID=3155040 RepID=UPI0033F9C8AD